MAFGAERLVELGAVGHSKLEAAEFEPQYGNERSQSGARSARGPQLHVACQERPREGYLGRFVVF